MKNRSAVTPAIHSASRRMSDTVDGFRFDVMISESGERSLRIQSSAHKSVRPVELIVPASQAYRFMEAVIHFVASMEKREMQKIARGKK